VTLCPRRLIPTWPALTSWRYVAPFSPARSVTRHRPLNITRMFPLRSAAATSSRACHPLTAKGRVIFHDEYSHVSPSFTRR